MNILIGKPGVVCSAGNNLDELWNSVVSGNQKGIKKVQISTGDEFFAGKIDVQNLKPVQSGRYDMKIIRMEEAAINQIEDQINDVCKKYSPSRVAVCVGSCDNGSEFSVEGHKSFFEKEQFPADYDIEMQGADYVASYVSERFEISGPSLAFSTACSSSGSAVVKACQLIKSGLVDAAIVGGVDVASETALAGFNSLEAVSPEVTNPFSKNRKGITLGDAAVFFVLQKDEGEETGETAGKSAGGAGVAAGKPVCETCTEGGGTAGNTGTVAKAPSVPVVKLLGYGESADAHHATSPDPSGDGAARAMEAALKNAGLFAAKIDYLNLHGTGTRLNDSMESKAVARVLEGAQTVVSSTKPVTGHTLGAAAALELSICYKAIIENFDKNCNNVLLPLQVWDKQSDQELPELNFVNQNPVNKAIRICMSNSFAFGGANVSLILGC